MALSEVLSKGRLGVEILEALDKKWSRDGYENWIGDMKIGGVGWRPIKTPISP